MRGPGRVRIIVPKTLIPMKHRSARRSLDPAKRLALAALCALPASLVAAQPASGSNAVIWRSVAEQGIAARVFQLDRAELERVLRAAPLESSDRSRKARVVLTVPSPDGKMVRFRIEESPILAPEIAVLFPHWKTYQGYGIDEPAATARFDWTDRGFHGYVLDPAGTYAIDPYQANDSAHYRVFRKRDYGDRPQNFHCRLDELIREEKLATGPVPAFPQFAHGAQLRTYRLAVATTVEYTNFFRQAGDTDAQAQTRAFNQVAISVNRIVGIYRRELSVSFTLVSGTNLIYVVNPETPINYSNNGSSTDLTANQTNVNTIIGPTNYDVGHLFETGDGGVAALASVCGTSKAQGLSGLPNPMGDPFDVDYVAHELGHQFAMNHTFNATNNCGSAPTAARKEPGSAVTIMGYAGICGSDANVQRNSIETFHVHNLAEAIAFLTTGAGATCGTLSTPNAAPVIAPLANYTIPFNTPFFLTAGATDADGDPLTYNWEQNDSGASASNYPNIPDDDDVSLVFRPGFRSYLPVTNPTRTFPSLPYILNHSNEAPITFTGTSAVGAVCTGSCITGEDLPSAGRTMNFRVSVRDGKGGISDAGTVLTVVNTGTPFKVTTQNSSPATWTGGQTRNVTWDVSGTTASGINTASVRISLSTDGGQSFPMILASSTPNDGAESIVVPNEVLTAQARLKVEAIGNIFFDISDANFRIVPSAPYAITNAASRKTHGSAGDFEVPLPLSGSPGVENRVAGGGGAHTLVVRFNRFLSSGSAMVFDGTGAVSGAPVINGNAMTINLTGVTDAQLLTVRLQNVTNTEAEVLPDTNVTVGFLLGDVNGTGSVNATDVSLAKSISGEPVSAGNFRADTNVSGAINATDISIVKSRSGNTLAPSTTPRR